MIAKPVLDELDQSRFKALVQAFPGKVVLAQVPFSAFIEGRNFWSRLRLRKMQADFLISHADFRPQAVIRFQTATSGSQDIPERVEVLKRAGIRHITIHGPANKLEIANMARGLLHSALTDKPDTPSNPSGR